MGGNNVLVQLTDNGEIANPGGKLPGIKHINMNTEKTYKDGVNEERQRILDILESFKNFYLRMTQCNNPYSCQMAAEKMETIDQVIDRIKQ